MVSVIVPVYNVEEYLPKCIDSILAQTYEDWELILVNDGSSDGSGQICDEYQKKDSRIVVVHKENGGVSTARNEGLKIAKGQYVAFVDSDDWVHREYLHFLMKGIDSGADVSVCSMLETARRDAADALTENPEYISMDKKEFFYQMLHSAKIGGFLCNKLFKKALIRQMLNEDIYYSEDFVFCAQYAEKIGRAVFVDEPLYYYWKNENSVTNMHGAYNDRIFSLLEAEKLLRKIYVANLPECKDRITLNLLKVALNLRARYKYNKCSNVQQYHELQKIIKQYYPAVKKSKRIDMGEKINVFMTKNFPVTLLKMKAAVLRRRLRG